MLMQYGASPVTASMPHCAPAILFCTAADPLCWHGKTRARNAAEYLRATERCVAEMDTFTFPYLNFHRQAALGTPCCHVIMCLMLARGGAVSPGRPVYLEQTVGTLASLISALLSCWACMACSTIADLQELPLEHLQVPRLCHCLPHLWRPRLHYGRPASDRVHAGLCCSENDTLCDPDGSKLLYARSKVREAPALGSHWPTIAVLTLASFL